MMTTSAYPLAATDPEPSGIAGWSVALMEILGGPGAALAIALENVFPPLPSEVILPLAGFTASQGHLGLVEVIVWTTVGSVVGAWCLYGIGAWLGPTRLRALVGRVPLMHVSDVDRTIAWFERHGAKAVFFGRMIPIFRSLISVPAGLTRMRPVQFTLLTACGSLVWNTVLIVGGYYLGESWHLVEEHAGTFQQVVVAVVAIAVGVFLVRRVHRVLKERTAE